MPTTSPISSTIKNEESPSKYEVVINTVSYFYYFSTLVIFAVNIKLFNYGNKYRYPHQQSYS
jgi:hypothetical protein